MAAPKDLLEFRNALKKAASDFGFTDPQNGRLRDNLFDDNDVLSPHLNNFWLGFIREDQDSGGKYEGLSFVVFPESNGNTRCVVSIGIGSSTTDDTGGGSLGPDMELASKPLFIRSFRSLTKRGDSDAQFFFKLDFTEMHEPTPGLKKALEDPSEPPSVPYDPVMINMVATYDHGKKGGLLPASMLVDYTSIDGYNLIISWLAQYAKWRNWCSFKNGNIQEGRKKRIEEAIMLGTCEKESPGPNKVLEILKEKRFIILQGAPGCGKTWTANEISRNDFFGQGQTKFIQFHAETSYADFIYGIKPALKGNGVAYMPDYGALIKILEEALKPENKGKNYLLIIDEINRANLANVLGPVFYLFEQSADNRTHKLTIGLDKNNKPIEYSFIPDNLYVIGTMNTADKSLAVVDFALRRRFAWVTLRPHKLDLDKDPKYQFDEELFDEISKIFTEYATDEELNLQPGQSYFKYPRNKEN